MTLVIGDEDVETFLSFRNLQRVSIVPVSCMNTYDFLDNKALVVTKQALEKTRGGAGIMKCIPAR